MKKYFLFSIVAVLFLGGYLIMSDGSMIDVSRNRKETLLKRLLPYRE